jgi:hypothetical protein
MKKLLLFLTFLFAIANLQAQKNVEIGLGARLNRNFTLSPGLGISVPLGSIGAIYTEFSRVKYKASYGGLPFGNEILDNVDVIFQKKALQTKNGKIQWLIGGGPSFARYTNNTGLTGDIIICFTPDPPTNVFRTNEIAYYLREGYYWGGTVHNTVRVNINRFLAFDTKAIVTAYNFDKTDEKRQWMPNYVLQTGLVYKIGL